MMKKISQILVPVTGTPADEPAIRLACQIARQDKAKVLAVHIIEVKRAMPLDSESNAEIDFGERVLAQAEQIAKAHGIKMETELLQARLAGPTVVNEASDRNVDLIIMSIPYRDVIGEFRLGTTASHIMKMATCQVWLCRQAVQAEEDSRPAKRADFSLAD
jgi:nucleotide-binding universal stress UspA family protein